MKYAQIITFEVCNGKYAGVSIFVQGCDFHCKGCFNQETWDFNKGKEFTQEIKNKLFEAIDRPYIKRISILGGEPLAYKNVLDVFNLIRKIKNKFPDKALWLYTGFTWNQIFHPVTTDDFNPDRNQIFDYRKEIIKMCDVLVDGRYVDELRDLTLRFKGSSNQRIIDVKASLEQNKVVLWE